MEQCVNATCTRFKSEVKTFLHFILVFFLLPLQICRQAFDSSGNPWKRLQFKSVISASLVDGLSSRLKASEDMSWTWITIYACMCACHFWWNKLFSSRHELKRSYNRYGELITLWLLPGCKQISESLCLGRLQLVWINWYWNQVSWLPCRHFVSERVSGGCFKKIFQHLNIGESLSRQI